MIESFNMGVPASTTSIQPVINQVLWVLEYHLWPEDDRVKVDLALREALMNAVQHGCKNDPSKAIECEVTVNEDTGELLISVRDEGQGFDFAAVPDPLDPSRLMCTNGRGVFLITHLMDHVSYVDGGREVQMRKRRSHHDLCQGAA